MLNSKHHKIFYGIHMSALQVRAETKGYGRTHSTANICLLQVFVNDSKVFGDYKCVATNQLGQLEHQIVMKEGTKPESPAKVCARWVNVLI